MALKFLNKKGWHTGSLRNIENVWKAEQKHDAEQRKLDEIRKQIQEEKERFEFRLLQEKAGLVPRQERLEFLYESGLAVGKTITSNSSSSGVTFKAPEEPAPAPASTQPSASLTTQEPQSAPGALFEEKPQSANDAWRKLHSDPLLLIRQREQEALARIKSNPIQMAPILKQIEEVKRKKERRNKKKNSEESDAAERRRRERREEERRREQEEEDKRRRVEEEERHRRRKRQAHRMTDEERASKRREMEMNAEMHEEQRWKRVKKADEDDAKEALNSTQLRGRNFLEAAQKSVYGTEKGGSSTVEESVRRRAYYSQRSSADGNAFRR